MLPSILKGKSWHEIEIPKSNATQEGNATQEVFLSFRELCQPTYISWASGQ